MVAIFILAASGAGRGLKEEERIRSSKAGKDLAAPIVFIFH